MDMKRYVLGETDREGEREGGTDEALTVYNGVMSLMCNWHVGNTTPYYTHTRAHTLNHTHSHAKRQQLLQIEAVKLLMRQFLGANRKK